MPGAGRCRKPCELDRRRSCASAAHLQARITLLERCILPPEVLCLPDCHRKLQLQVLNIAVCPDRLVHVTARHALLPSRRQAQRRDALPGTQAGPRPVRLRALVLVGNITLRRESVECLCDGLNVSLEQYLVLIPCTRKTES